ncbi:MULTISPECIES: hypothetical protein [Geomicrobium]|uniref:Uncharacterized protein n=1 Tax=Geomicrobium sediminis TaxID=1347788 RepID=A0ABS2PGJ3_9BACL|nr:MULTISPECIES: hypothetical protein [Geomicrobium]MBM7634397.1 hypothetical protein [Geomicrobium sediminis]
MSQLTFKEKCIKTVKYQKGSASTHSIIGFILTLMVLLVFM